MRCCCHEAVQNCSSLDQQSHGLFCSQVKFHLHSYSKQNHYAQQYNISRTTRSGLFVWSSLTDIVGLFHWQLRKSVRKTWIQPVKTIFIYIWCLTLLLSLGGPTSSMQLFIPWGPRMKPLCQCFQLMVQFHLNTLSFFLFFSTFCICKHHFCNISFVVHCHCILYTCPIHCRQPLVCMISPSIFPLFFGTKVKLNWVDQLCSLCALISSTYPLWDNKINTQERLSAL